MCKNFPIFCPQKISGLDAHVEVSRQLSSGTLVTSEPYVPKRHTRFSENVWKRKRKKVHRNYSDYLIWFIILWRGRGAKWRQQCLDSFFMGCINTCHRVFRFTTALFTLDELLYQLAPPGWPIKEPTGLFAPDHGKWSWLPIKERVEKEFKELAS